jgi:hypothetical protein
MVLRMRDLRMRDLRKRDLIADLHCLFWGLAEGEKRGVEKR